MKNRRAVSGETRLEAGSILLSSPRCQRSTMKSSSWLPAAISTIRASSLNLNKRSRINAEEKKKDEEEEGAST